jgi:hypothetical protein
MLSNPAKATKSSLAGIAHVISRMEWYCALAEHLLDRDNIKIGNTCFKAILQQLEERVKSLYKALLLYQMKSVCSYYRNQGLVFLRGLLNLDDWTGDLTSVMNAETAVRNDTSQYIQEHMKTSLGEAANRAEEVEKRLGDIRQDIREFISLQKSILKDDVETACRRDLRVVDPQHDMERIEKSKDELLDDAYKWILDTPEYAAFANWNDDTPDGSQCRLLWIKGHAGTGKTMLMIGAIRELSHQPVVLAPKLSFFFCQSTDTDLNNATAVLRSLIWLLLIQQPYLTSHLLQKYKESGADLFKDRNAFYALSETFRNMLKDPDLSPVYFAVDALDECEQGLAELMKLISMSLTLSDKVKWLISSRPTVELKTPDIVGSPVELDAQRLEDPVNAYINHKLSTLKSRDGYDEYVLAKVGEEVRQRAENTFLWAALMFKELDAEDENLNPVHGAYALETIEKIPCGLSRVYDYMMTKIEKGMKRDPQYCKNVLVAAVLAYRPLTLSELAVLADLPLNMHPKTIVRKCGSFLITRDETVYLVHQSAKDYLDENYESKLHSAGVAQGHTDVTRRSINAMSLVLKQNMYDLPFGFRPKDRELPNPDPLAPIRYSCIFWADHLCLLKSESPECKEALADDGVVLGFLKERFLRWLESLSLLGKLSDGALSMRKLLIIVQVCGDRRSYIQPLIASRYREWVLSLPDS